MNLRLIITFYCLATIAGLQGMESMSCSERKYGVPIPFVFERGALRERYVCLSCYVEFLGEKQFAKHFCADQEIKCCRLCNKKIKNVTRHICKQDVIAQAKIRALLKHAQSAVE